MRFPLRSAAFVLLLSGAVAGTALSQPPGGGGAGVSTGLALTWFGAAAVAGQDEDLEISRRSLTFTAPVHRAGSGSYSLTGSVQLTRLQGRAQLAESGRLLPQELWNASLGVGHMRRTETGRIFGWNAGVVSAGPRFFGGDGATKPTFFAFLRTPTAGGRDAWTVALIYLPFSDIRFPIPVASYTWGAAPNLTIDIGAPLSVKWQPRSDVTVEASWIPVLNVDSRVAWRTRPGLEWYAGYVTTRDTYVLTDRADPDDLLLENQQRLHAGAVVGLGRASSLDIQGGYAFDRRYGEGRDGDRQSANRVDLADGAFVTVSLRSTF